MLDKENLTKFGIIVRYIREKYFIDEFRAKSNSIYRNSSKIMEMFGYLLSEPFNYKNLLTNKDAFKLGMDQSPSTWSQLSKYITHFKLVDNWRKNTEIILNEKGLELKNLIKKNYSNEKLKSWNIRKDGDVPEIVKNYYCEILRTQLIDDFTPTLKTYFCTINMLINNELFKQNENTSTSQVEREKIEKYFDLTPGTRNLKWVGHFGRGLVGFGLAELSSNKYNFIITKKCETLVKDIIKNWDENYPEFFLEIYNFSEFDSYDPYNYEEKENSKNKLERYLRPILLRRGQKNFREGLLKLYENKCAITSEQTIQVLEACHIEPYSKKGENNLENGILLRSDLHTLFDLKLITINPSSHTVEICNELKTTRYNEIHGKKINKRISISELYVTNHFPSNEYLKQHYKASIKEQNYGKKNI